MLRLTGCCQHTAPAWHSGTLPKLITPVPPLNLTELINKVAENGYSLRVVEESDQQSTCTLPPFATLAGIRCSTAHITEKDNAWLYSLSHQTSDFGESEWIHFTGSGYLLRTDAWSYPVLRWICPYISRHLLSLNPLLACCRRYSRGER